MDRRMTRRRMQTEAGEEAREVMMVEDGEPVEVTGEAIRQGDGVGMVEEQVHPVHFHLVDVPGVTSVTQRNTSSETALLLKR